MVMNPSNAEAIDNYIKSAVFVILHTEHVDLLSSLTFLAAESTVSSNKRSQDYQRT